MCAALGGNVTVEDSRTMVSKVIVKYTQHFATEDVDHKIGGT